MGRGQRLTVDSGRREELEQRRARARYAAAQRRIAADLAVRGLPVGPDEFLSLEAHNAALATLAAQRRLYLVWHRIWGVRMRAGMESTMRRLAELIGDEPVMLVWGSPAPSAFAVWPQAALHALDDYVGPDDGNAGRDLMLVTDEGPSGLVLAYRHLADVDEDERRSRGHFAIALDG